MQIVKTADVGSKNNWLLISNLKIFLGQKLVFNFMGEKVAKTRENQAIDTT